jgi:proteasome beta subunit
MNEEISKTVLKTGTLTVGIVCKDGIVIAADKRGSYGASGGGVAYVAGTVKKIQELNERMITTMAGTVSDAKKVLDVLKAEIRLQELKTKTSLSVAESASLLANLSYQGIRTPSMIPQMAHFLLAGYDEKGLSLFDISPDGYLENPETYTATGSGIMQAHPILDTEYKKGISIEDGIKLAVKCIKAAIGRDPAVGNGVDVYIVKKGEIKQVLAQEVSYDLKNRS